MALGSVMDVGSGMGLGTVLDKGSGRGLDKGSDWDLDIHRVVELVEL